MASERRQAQIAKRIQQKISELLLHEIRDPRIGFITITGVTITRDLTEAKVRWSVLDLQERSKVEHMFRHAGGFLRREVAREINIRFAPTLKFEYDQGLAAAARIEEVLRKVLPPEERGPEVPPADLGRNDD
ncbi:MAG: 30S ribosome-binding factor RbfA [Planctomycetota bacterium]|jgi:ribosome-binding factor A